MLEGKGEKSKFVVGKETKQKNRQKKDEEICGSGDVRRGWLAADEHDGAGAEADNIHDRRLDDGGQVA